jgi:hypothetical protein
MGLGLSPIFLMGTLQQRVRKRLAQVSPGLPDFLPSLLGLLALLPEVSCHLARGCPGLCPLGGKGGLTVTSEADCSGVTCQEPWTKIWQAGVGSQPWPARL